VCNKVAVPKTKQVCNRVCTKTTVTTEQMPSSSTVTSTGKGGKSMVMVSTGKGHRRLAGAESTDMLLPLLAGKALIAKAAGAMIGAKVVAGGAMMAHAAPQIDVQCNDVSQSKDGAAIDFHMQPELNRPGVLLLTLTVCVCQVQLGATGCHM
jgi:hypothetical protein